MRFVSYVGNGCQVWYQRNRETLGIVRIMVMSIKLTVDVSKWWVLLGKRHGLEAGGECYSKVNHLSTGVCGRNSTRRWVTKHEEGIIIQYKLIDRQLPQLLARCPWHNYLVKSCDIGLQDWHHIPRNWMVRQSKNRGS